jgi:hypothetical protein
MFVQKHIPNILVKVMEQYVFPLLHIVPFCEGKKKKPEGFAKQKQPAIFVM